MGLVIFFPSLFAMFYFREKMLKFPPKVSAGVIPGSSLGPSSFAQPITNHQPPPSNDQNYHDNNNNDLDNQNNDQNYNQTTAPAYDVDPSRDQSYQKETHDIPMATEIKE